MMELSIDAFNNFKCIGELCEDHCCKEKLVSIDKTTYKKYKREENKEFKELFRYAISKLPEGKENKYAVMNLYTNGNCCFLDENNLCRIYKLLGQNNMCHTCKTYPRYSIKVGNYIYKTINLSCPEACRKVLFRENPIEFNIRKMKQEETMIPDKKLDPSKEGYFTQNTFVKLRSFAIDLLQNRNYTIQERLIIFGLFAEDINNKDEEEVINIMQKYTKDIDNNIYVGLANYFNSDSLIDNEIGYSIKAYLKVLTKFESEKSKISIMNMKEGFGINEDCDFNEVKSNYIEIKNKYYRPFIQNYEYVFENYLVNYAFRNMLMLSKENLFIEYAQMIVYFAMMKFLIMGNCGTYKEEMDEDKLVLTISTFARSVEHSQTTALLTVNEGDKEKKIRVNIEEVKGLIKECELEKLSNLIPLILI
jgi:lysine-N-methylase